MEGNFIAHFYALPRLDRLYFLLRLRSHPAQLLALYYWIESHGDEQDLPSVFHNHYRFWQHYRVLLPQL